MIQKSIKKSIIFSGYGLHKKQESNLILNPAPSNYGIKINGLEINPITITNTFGMTTIRNYSMIEHLMSALYALNIDNLEIILEGSTDIPILDGCSRLFLDKILEVGIEDLDSSKCINLLEEEIIIQNNDSYLKYIPSNQGYLEFICCVDFPYIGKQEYKWKSNDFDDYYNNISNALTFFWDDQLEMVKSQGNAQGVTDYNTIILTNENFKLYNNSEFAKHKLLDLIGDLATLNIKLEGKIIAYKPGHKINNMFARRIQEKLFENSKFFIPFMKLPINRNMDKLTKNINNVLTTQNYIDNNIVVEFENKLSKYLDVRNVIAVNCGTSALIVSILSLELNNEDIVIVPRLTFWATYEAPKILGKRIILVDVDEDYQLNINLVRELLKKHKVKVIITVHLYGIVSNNYNQLVEICDENNIILMEDSSQAFGSIYGNKNILSNSYISCVSMYPTKIYGSCGNSGFIVTSDDNLANKMRSYRDNGRKDTRYDHYFIAGNFVMDTINAIYNLNKLTYISDIINNTSFKFELYQKELSDLTLLKIPKLTNQIPNGFNFIIKSLVPHKRNRIIFDLKKNNIAASVIYPKFIDQQEGYQKNNDDLLLSCNDSLCQDIFSIPIYYDLRAIEQFNVIKNVYQNDKINTVLIGCGNMGSKHLKNLIINEKFNLIGYLDKVDYNLETRYLENLDDNIDFALISTSTQSHFEWALKCIEKKIHILIEKPALIDFEQYNNIFQLSEKFNIRVGVSMIERYNKFIEPINLEKIDRIIIKRVCNYSHNFDKNTILHDLLIHDLDILRYYHQIDFEKIVIKSLIRKKDIYHINLIFNEINIDITVGNTDELSSRIHTYYLKDKSHIEYDFMNSYNKLKDLHDDYINFLVKKPNKMCTLNESKELFKIISKIYSKEEIHINL